MVVDLMVVDLMVATFKYNIFGLSSVLRIFSANVPALELYGGFFFHFIFITRDAERLMTCI